MSSLTDAFGQLLLGDKAAVGAFCQAALTNQTNIQKYQADALTNQTRIQKSEAAVSRTSGLLWRQNQALRKRDLVIRQLKRKCSKKDDQLKQGRRENEKLRREHSDLLAMKAENDNLLERERRNNETLRRQHSTEVKAMRADFVVEHKEIVVTVEANLKGLHNVEVADLKKVMDQDCQTLNAALEEKEAVLVEMREEQEELLATHHNASDCDALQHDVGMLLAERDELNAAHVREQSALKESFVKRQMSLNDSCRSQVKERDLRNEQTVAANELAGHQLSFEKNLNLAKDATILNYIDEYEKSEKNQKTQLLKHQAVLDKELAHAESVEAATQKRLDQEKSASQSRYAKTKKRLSLASAGLSTVMKSIDNSPSSRLNPEYIAYMGLGQAHCEISSEIGDPKRLKSLAIGANAKVIEMHNVNKSRTAKKNEKRRAKEKTAKVQSREAKQLVSLASPDNEVLNAPEVAVSAVEIKAEPAVADLIALGLMG